MDTSTLTVLAVALVAFGLISGRLEKSILTPPLVFAAFGLAASQHGLGLLEVDVAEPVAHLIAELTLVLVLFTDASRIDLGLLRREHDLPVRLLAVGMPLTLVAGTLVAIVLLPELTLWPAALLAAILMPTDAALGQAVVSDPRVPTRVRQALNVESGLNDGIALPVILVLISVCGVAAGEAGPEGVGGWMMFAMLQVTFGPLVGVAVGWIGGKLVDRATASGWMSHPFQSLSALSLSILAFAGAELVHGNGFIAAFCAGLTLGNVTRHLCSRLYEFGEAEGQLMTLLVFFGFGATMLPEALHHLSWQTLLYAALSLTVVRLIPVAIGLMGKGLRRETVFFLGWFGPRGIASILFALLVLEGSGAPLPEHELVVAVVMLTVALSIVAHGVTAYPAAGWYARRMGTGELENAHEHREVEEMPVRTRHG